MKLQNIFRLASVAVASGSMLLGVTSCNYLDVVPPEQPGLPDAMKTHAAAQGFLYSCYSFLNTREWQPRDYTGQLNGATDEYCLPLIWYAEDGKRAYSVMLNTQTTDAAGSGHNEFWNQYYTGIGQCLLFERELDGEGAKNGVCNETERERWLAETRFLKAYYHFLALRLYGPIPLTTTLDVPENSHDISGRTSFETCVNYIAGELDGAATTLERLGFNTLEEEELGRATSVMCRSIKARLLLYAASPLWNGEFPYAEWGDLRDKAGNPFVPRTKDASKWVRAYVACKQALDAATAAGHELWTASTIDADESVLPSAIYVPGQVSTEFKEAVARMRYAVSTTVAEGNKEIIWGIKALTYGWKNARHPIGVTQNSNGIESNSWGGVAPTLYTATHFLTANGLLPEHANSGVTNYYGQANVDKNRPNIINLCVNREPRFYAWIGFNGGDYLTRLKNGNPLTLDFLAFGSGKQGHVRGARNYTSTGFISMKHIDPATRYMENNTANTFEATGDKDSPSVLIRMAELYLNLAEAAAEIAADNSGLGSYIAAHPEHADMLNVDFAQEAMNNVNIIRERAGLTGTSQLTADKLALMSLVEWVRAERFIELYDEGIRYFDIRRWVKGEELCGPGTRMGLNGVEAEVTDFSKFNTPVVIDQQYTFHKRQYLQPLYADEVYSNPNMVQAPGF